MTQATIATEQLTQEIAALRMKVDALLDALGPRITREQLCKRRGCHRNTIPAVMERGIVPRPDVQGRYLLTEVIAYEAIERSQKRAANTEVVRPEGCERTQS
jgi:hypothetical protein